MAARKSTYKVEVELSLKKEVDEALKTLGYPGANTAIFHLLLYIRDHKDLPPELKYNQQTLETLRKTRRGEDLITYESKEALYEDLRKL